ncbi:MULTISPECIES: hypothetical protein [Klebsiella pneumoniae complex]|uniref:hypothetical protein n=1 Tax=Klebsiella pneumoniae complex TaxID=3390273 RepID=UPI0004529299|nr:MULTISPECIES: hypothetical protein [Klebsiella]DAY50169.1 MAG TPA: TIGR02646 family protein [Caudoviricetes sp.]HBQ3196690.1 hypothetical protein [Klebsiella variicola subsp. variicola]EIX9775491.1 hypothetical protein [Klebsiella pneumoniae]EWF75597.1 hypothetical protein L385_01472 [Klebsiella pneumoniae MGH 39]KAA6134412.1 HNH endonuclease [Klebsiella pneumoniae subsp. pneumoniae]
MFNVVRPLQVPPSLALQRTYKSEDVIDALRVMFHNKCYLCEQDSLADPEVEHFVPHNRDPLLKFGWGNLFYACRRCNGIKSNSHVNLLDCTLPNSNVSSEIVHFAGNAAVGEILIRASSNNPSQQVINTVNLINKCFNLDNTSLRKVSKESLMEKLLIELGNYLPLRDVLATRLSTQNDIQSAKNSLAIMCADNYPFSIFWKWHILKDVQLSQRFPNLRTELGF